MKEVRGFYEEQYAQESRFHTLRAQMLIHAVQLKRANDEQSSYMSKDKATKSTRLVEKTMGFSQNFFHKISESYLTNKLVIMKYV